MEFKSLIIVASGGSIGAISRYLITFLINFLNIPLFWATFTVNIIGSFFIGFFVSFLSVHNNLKLFLITGFLGSFTTFSTFMLDSVILFDNKKFFMFCCNILFNLILGIFFVKIGLFLGSSK